MAFMSKKLLTSLFLISTFLPMVGYSDTKGSTANKGKDQHDMLCDRLDAQIKQSQARIEQMKVQIEQEKNKLEDLKKKRRDENCPVINPIIIF
jgi:peptidoglycan hydrolase CwlO-like protein